MMLDARKIGVRHPSVSQNLSGDGLFWHTRPFDMDFQCFGRTSLEVFEPEEVEARLEGNLAGPQTSGVGAVVVDDELVADEQNASVIG